MECIELSLEELKDTSIEVAKKIILEKKIDLIIYIAKAGFPIAMYMNEVFHCELLGIVAKRKGNRLKEILGPILSYCPKVIRNGLIKMELKSKVHMHDIERHVMFEEKIDVDAISKFKTILIVDDSVDTGNSALAVLNEVKSIFKDSTVLFYALNVWSQSKSVVSVDYLSFSDTIIKAPMSKDSKEYKKFIEMYQDFIKKRNI
ncbi:MAG: phosphoribosyltransferase [Lachnospiraceae bacterium]|nr:phosphoribosyltransferase [Lachnospiraceae bacterium]